MLILTRRVGERLKIGDAITVTVLGIKGVHVRLGIDAPREVPVDREEVAERKRAEAASTALDQCPLNTPHSTQTANASTASDTSPRSALGAGGGAGRVERVPPDVVV